MRYLVTNPKEGSVGSDIHTKFHSDEPLLEVKVGETKEVSERAAKWLAYTYAFIAITEVPDMPKVKPEYKLEVEKPEVKKEKVPEKKVQKKSK